LPKVFESFGPGVMEYWSVEKKHQAFLHYSNTPLLQLVAPKSHLIVTKGDTPKLFEIESSHDGSPSFGL
jgi:hypothetical protein